MGSLPYVAIWKVAGLQEAIAKELLQGAEEFVEIYDSHQIWSCWQLQDFFEIDRSLLHSGNLEIAV